MIIDARKLAMDTRLTADVIIVGGGVAGITLALDLEAKGIDTIILESGGHKPDDATRDLSRGESTAIPYYFADGCRSRFLGGSSNCWGGWCRPLDDWDFEKRDWIANSGWPIKGSDLAPYYLRTHSVLELGSYNYDIDLIETAINRPDVRRMPLLTGRVMDSISRFSPPTRMGKRYGSELEAARHVRTYLYANVVDIEAGPDVRDVRRVKCRTLSGKSFTADGRIYVLAMGGIENARLLLASNKVAANGLGNDHDLVGRFFMDHPRLSSGSIRFRDGWNHNKLFDVKHHYHNPEVAISGTSVAGALVLTPEVQEREQLTNARVWLSSVFLGEYTEAIGALRRLKRRLAHREPPEMNLSDNLLTLAKHPLDAAGAIMVRLLKMRLVLRRITFQAIVEPEPDPASRVTLSDRRDALGLPRVQVGWTLSPTVRRTFDRNFAIMADEFEKAGIADVDLDDPTECHDTSRNEGTWHHMGTTRMHDSPRQGVVDKNCQVHGLENLFIAGSSVFPTAGANFPTQTIVALSMRLADHITKTLKASTSADLSEFPPLTISKPMNPYKMSVQKKDSLNI